MDDIVLYSTNYGQVLQIRTWLADIDSATSISIDLHKLGNAATPASVSLSATVITSYPAGTLTNPIVASEYGVQATIPAAWATTRIGRWVGQVSATFPSCRLSGKPFIVEIKAPPSGV